MPIVGDNFLPLILAIVFCIFGIGLLCIALFVIKRPKKGDATKQPDDSIKNAGLRRDGQRGHSVLHGEQSSAQNNPRNVAYDRNARLSSQQGPGSNPRGKHQK